MFGLEIKDLLLLGITTLLGAVSFLVRKIFTSEKKIAMLEISLADMKQERIEHDEKIDRMLTELRIDIKNLLSRP